MRMKFLFPIDLSISFQAMGSSDRLFYILILPFVQSHIVKFEPILLYFASDYSSLIRQTQYNKIDKNTLLFRLYSLKMQPCLGVIITKSRRFHNDRLTS